MRRTLFLVIVLLATSVQPANAWDPFADELDAGPDGAPDPAPFVVPDGLYAVTDVYAGDVVSTWGNTTMYTTETVHETPGTYARVVDVVGSGSSSVFDGSSFNTRAALSDGRAVAGTYYEDFVLTAAGFVSVNVVFFQDDSATRMAAPTPPPPAVTATPTPVATRAPAAIVVPVATPTPGTTPRPAPEPQREPAREGARVPVASAGVALGADAPVVASAEVLRGRTLHLWPRAFVDGAAVPVRSWRLASGGADVVSRVSGGFGDACDVIWLTPTGADAPAALRFEVTSDAVPGRVLTATVTVTVRSPALMQ